MRLTKIYTKIGDKGTTRLATGVVISKDNERIEAYGTVDELNSVVGILRDHLANQKECSDFNQPLLKIQNELFDVGAELSLPNYEKQGIKLAVVNDSDVERLEKEIDSFNANLPPLENFILPGGHPAVSFAHLARTVCRRAERRVVSLSHLEPVRPELFKYLNRLSDWLFVFGRMAAKRLNVEETLWQQRK